MHSFGRSVFVFLPFWSDPSTVNSALRGHLLKCFTCTLGVFNYSFKLYRFQTFTSGHCHGFIYADGFKSRAAAHDHSTRPRQKGKMGHWKVVYSKILKYSPWLMCHAFQSRMTLLARVCTCHLTLCVLTRQLGIHGNVRKADTHQKQM